MEIIFVLVSVLQSIAISLGVGCSTVAITSFFVAISDGEMDAGERRILGVVYILLRIAMVAILITTAILAYVAYSVVGEAYFTTYAYMLWLFIAVLFINAVLMTKHIIPHSIGPGIQASAWYSMGIMVALPSSFVVATSLTFLGVWYAAFTTGVTLFVYLLVQSFKKKNKS